MKQTKVKFIAFCDYALIDSKNKLSVMGIFDQVNVSKFPGGISRAFFVAMIKTIPNKKTKFSIKGNLGNRNIFPAVEMDAMVGETGQHNIMIDLAGFAFPEEGIYQFDLYQDNEKIGSTELRVVQAGGHNYEPSKLPN